MLRPYQSQIHAGTDTRKHRCTQITVWVPYGDFYFSNFDLSYFNKYRMDFNPVKIIII